MSDLPPFVVIADAHIAPTAGLQDYFLEEALAKAEAAAAQFVIIGGDLVEDGHQTSYKSAKAILQTGKLPWYTVIGNKELNQNSPQHYISHFGPTHYSVELSGYRIIALGTQNFVVPRHKLRWLCEVLKSTAPHENTIIVMHHYLDGFRQADRQALIDICAKHGAYHVITAHRHRMETIRHGSVTEHMMQAIDPDKALGSLPGFTICQLRNGQFHARFIPLSMAPDTLQRHLIGQLGLAPTGKWHPGAEISELSARFSLRYYQLRISSVESEDDIRRQARIATECGMQLVGHLPTPEFDTDGRWLNRNQMHWVIQFCSEVIGEATRANERITVLHPPKLPAAILCDPHGEIMTERSAVQRIMQAYTEMVSWLQEKELAVALENNSSKSRRTVFGALPSHLSGMREGLAQQGLSIGYCLDIGHVKASVVSTQVAEWMSTLGHGIRALHLHSGDPTSHTTHQPIQELYSTTRWSGMAGWLMFLGLTVPCLLEVGSPDAAATSIETLTRLLAPVPNAAHLDAELP
jgi:sugar phosphate isomerase/epimerase